MPTLRLSTEGFLLSKKTTGESYLSYQIFSGEHGLLLCLKRVSQKKTDKVQPDLFDRAQLDLEKPQTGYAWFVRDYEIIKRHTGIARNYNSLLCASEFASTLLKNLTHTETFAGLFHLTGVVFQSWEKGLNPELVLLKSLYLFAREEGYPVKQDWWQNLPPSEREEATRLLNNKIETLNIDDEKLQSILQNFKKWLPQGTDILL